MDVFVLNIIFSCRKIVKIRVDLMIKLQQFTLLPYRWSKNPLRRNGNNYLTWISKLMRNGNKPSLAIDNTRLIRRAFNKYAEQFIVCTDIVCSVPEEITWNSHRMLFCLFRTFIQHIDNIRMQLFITCDFVTSINVTWIGIQCWTTYVSINVSNV